MKKILLLFIFLNTLLYSIESKRVDVNISKSLSDSIVLMKKSNNFQDYALSILTIKEIYQQIEQVSGYKNILKKNPLPSNKIIFEKIKFSKYNILEEWKNSVLINKPKNISLDKLKKVEKLMLNVSEKIRPILDKIYLQTKMLIIDSSDKNIRVYKSYINMIKEKNTPINSEVDTIVKTLGEMIITSPSIYIQTHNEHQLLEKKYEQLVFNNKEKKCPQHQN